MILSQNIVIGTQVGKLVNNIYWDEINKVSNCYIMLRNAKIPKSGQTSANKLRKGYIFLEILLRMPISQK